MAASEALATERGNHVLQISRLFDAPRELVFEAWSRAEHQVHWMGPTDFTVADCEIDFRVGGRYRASIVSPTGETYCMRGEYREIVAAERLSFTFAWEEEGERGMENLITIVLRDEGGKTRMDFRQAPFQSISERDGHDTGWSQAFEKLAAYLGTGKLAMNAGEKI